MSTIILKASNKKEAWRKVKSIYGAEFTRNEKLEFDVSETAYSSPVPARDGYILEKDCEFRVCFADGSTIVVEYENQKKNIAELERENAKLREENIILRQKILKFGKVSRELKELLTATAEFSAFLEIIEKDAKQFEKEGEV